MAGRHHVEYGRVGVHLEKPAEKPVRSRHRHRRGKCAAPTDEQNRRRTKDQSAYLETKPEARETRHEAVRHPAASENRRERDKVVVEHRVRPSSCAVHPEPLVEHLGSPRNVCVVYAANGDEAGRRAERRGTAEERLERLGKPCTLFLLRLGPTSIPHAVVQEEHEHDTEQEPRRAKRDEDATPRPEQVKDAKRENTTQH